jgi:hypothetical protein
MLCTGLSTGLGVSVETLYYSNAFYAVEWIFCYRLRTYSRSPMDYINSVVDNKKAYLSIGF